MMMIPRALGLALACVALLVAAVAPADAREPISPAALATLTGVDKALEDVASAMAEEAANVAKEDPNLADATAFVAAWKSAALASFAPDKLKTSFAQRLTGKLTPDETNTVEDFYRSELGQRIVSAEIAGNSKAAQEAMASEALALMEKLEADPARKSALKTLSAAAQIDDMSITIALNVARAMMIGVASAQTSGQRLTLEDISQAIDQMREQTSKEMAALTALSMAYIYRNIPVGDLASYEAFMRTPVGAKFIDQVMKGLDAVISQASLSFGKALALELGRDPI